MNPTVEPTDDGLEVIDPIERRRYLLTTHTPVSLRPVSTARIPFPVTTAVELTAEMLTLPTNESVYVRDDDGSMIAEVRPSKQVSLPHDDYTLDISGPLKVYARVESEVTIYSDSERTYISFSEPTTVVVGARSYHRRPAETITTTAAPTDVMRAISTFGSALKSTTPERSYPTLRGHPPAVELGDELEIPPTVARPETGVRLEVPPTLGDVFTVVPLAYYLGAEVTPGPNPLVATDSGFTFRLDPDGDLETGVKRVLKQTFLLDCVVRTEGTTPLALYERQAIEPDLPFDIASVYDRSLAEQLETYLSVPFSTVEPQLPKWRLETSLEPTGETVAFLPFLADELAVVRTRKTDGGATEATRRHRDAIDSFTRNGGLESGETARGPETGAQPTGESKRPVIRQHWQGIDSRTIPSETPISAYRNSLGRTPKDDPIEIEVVCNDPEMRPESTAVDDIYGIREEVPFTVTVHHDVERDELEAILSADVDFLHFIGHIDTEGFQCADGYLDATTVESVGVKAFFLNACRSSEQGLQLVDAGSIGGIVTLDEVVNSGAIEVGGVVARLLNEGFPLYAAIDIARDTSITGEQYFIVGDGMTTIAQSETGPPLTCSIARRGEEFDITLETYLITGLRKGGLFVPYLKENDTHYLISGKPIECSLTKAELEAFLRMGQFPVVTDSDVFWSRELAVEEL